MNARHALAAGLLTGLLVLPSAGAAAPSPLSGSVEISGSTYRPDVDSEAALVAAGKTPYQTSFGSGRPVLFRFHAAKALPWRAYGTVELGLGGGYWVASGRGVDKDGNVTADPTKLKIIPTELTATYRLDFLWDRFSVPVIPFARLSLQRYYWWATGSTGATDKSGATNGYGYGGGLGLMLDMIDPTLAREFDADSGVNHTLLTFEVVRNEVNDFSSKKSFVLTDDRPTYRLGLLFVF